jgi:hydrogenase maturation protease
LRPRARGADAMDVILADKIAIVESIEQDYEGGFHVAVVVEDDPGRDLGLLRQPGHRFFYAPEEVERCADRSILIAGIGNIFLGDDGFGVAVAQRLLTRALPEGVRVVDYGIRSLDLAFALTEGPDVTILIDACRRGLAPGTLFVLEPEVNAVDVPESPPDAHAMNPLVVIRMAQSMGGPLKKLLLVGCEPQTLGPEEGQMGMSACVESAVDGAVDLAMSLVQQIRAGEWPGDERRRSA